MNMILISIIELAAVIAVIYGFIHEDELIAFEERICEALKRK